MFAPDALVRILTDGGIWSLSAVILGVIGVVLALVVPLVLGFARLKIPWALAWLGVLASLAIGAIGTFVAHQQALSAVATAPPEMKQSLLASGISIALYSALGSFLLGGLALLVYTLAGALPAVLRPGTDARFDVLGMGGALGGGLIGWIFAGAALTAFLGPSRLTGTGVAFPALLTGTLVIGLAVLIAGLRIGGDEAPDRGHTAAVRVSLGTGGALAIILGGWFWQIFDLIQVFKAVATATPEMKSVMLSAGIEMAGHASVIGWSLSVVPMLAGVTSALSAVRYLDGWSVGRIGATGFLGLAVLFVGSQVRGGIESTLAPLQSPGTALAASPREPWSDADRRRIAERTGLTPPPTPTADGAARGVVGGGDGMTFQGALDRDRVEAVIRDHQAQVEDCYGQALARDPELAGRLVVKIVIAGDGSVSAAQVPESDLDDTALAECLTGRVEGWRFPEPRGGGIVIVSYPFQFSPN